jgi:hypothetical protein
LRKDERFAVDAIVNFLGGSPHISAEDGEDPPDAYINANGKKVALEITRLSAISFDASGAPQNRLTEDYFGIRLLNELDQKLGALDPEGKQVMISIYVPVSNPREFKESVSRWISAVIPQLTSGWKVSRIGGTQVSAKIIESSADQKRIVGIVSNRNTSPDIGSNAKIILTERISSKESIFKKLNYSGSRWLGLFNDYWLADEMTYARAIQEGAPSHNFEKIFLVSDAGKVAQLYGET